MNSLYVEEEAVAASSFSVIGTENFNIEVKENVIVVEGPSDNDIFINKSGEGLTLQGKEGNDRYVLGGLEAKMGYVIDQSLAGKMDRDTLNLLEYASDAFTVACINGKDLTLHYSPNGATITIENWSSSPLKQIWFKDCRLKVENLGYALGQETYALTLKGEYGFMGKAAVEVDNSVVKALEQAQLTVSGTNNKIELEKEGSIHITGGENQSVIGTENNTVELSGGSINTLSFGEGINKLILSGGATASIACAGELQVVLRGSSYSLNKDCPYIPVMEQGNNELKIDDLELESLEGGAGNDRLVLNSGYVGTLKGGAGADVYELNHLEAGRNYVINQGLEQSVSKEEYGADTLAFNSYSYEDFDISSDADFNLILTNKENGAVIKVDNWKDNPLGSISFQDKTLSLAELSQQSNYYPVLSPLEMIMEFSRYITDSKDSSAEIFDMAVKTVSQGLYQNAQELVYSFIQDCVTHSGPGLEQRKSFLKEYCGVDLDNEDTGAITGLDAGNGVLKNAEDIVKEPEGMTPKDFVYNYTDKITTWDFFTEADKEFTCATVNCNGEPLTIFWDEEQIEKLAASGAVKNVEALYSLIAGIVEAWAEPCLNLVMDSYGISLTGKDSKLRTLSNGNKGLQLQLDCSGGGVSPMFVNNLASSAIAALYSWRRYDRPGYVFSTVSSYQALVINTYFYTEPMDDINGNGSTYDLVSKYLDRVLAHELTHGAMAANYYSWSNLPSFLLEGLAELVHGADDIRGSEIRGIVSTNYSSYSQGELLGQAESLRKLFDFDNTGYISTSAYGAGYVLMRYFAKTVADYRLGLLDSQQALFADEFWGEMLKGGTPDDQSLVQASPMVTGVITAVAPKEEKTDKVVGTVQLVYGADASYKGTTAADIVIVGEAANDACIISTEEGNDIIVAKEGAGHTLAGGQGNDRFVLGLLEEKGDYVIDQTGSRAKDRDTLRLFEYDSDAFTVQCTDGNKLILKNVDNDATITINNWCEAPLKYIAFRNGRLSVEQLGYASSESNYQLKLKGEYGFAGSNEVGADDNTLISRAGTLTVKGKDNKILLEGDASTLIQGDGNLIEGRGNNTVRLVSGSGNVVHLGQGRNTLMVSGVAPEELTSEGELALGFDKAAYELKATAPVVTVMGEEGKTIYIEAGQIGQLQGSEGNDTLVLNNGAVECLKGGAGADKYILNNLQADHTYVIDQGVAGTEAVAPEGDILVLNNYQSSDFELGLDQDNNPVLTHKEQSMVIQLKGWSENPLAQLQFKDRTIYSKELQKIFHVWQPVSQQEVIRTFVQALDNYDGIGSEIFNEAVSCCSQGFFENGQKLIDSFIQDCMEHSGSTYDEYMPFLREYCGIDLENADTGAISGYDAGGSEVKDKASVIKEKDGITLDQLVYDYPDKVIARDIFTGSYREFTCTTIDCGGKPFTIYWDEAEFDVLVEKGLVKNRECLEIMMGAILEGWLEPIFELIQESYGVTLTEEGSIVKILENGNPGLRVVLDYVSGSVKSPITVNNSASNLGAMYNWVVSESDENGKRVSNAYQLIAINTYRVSPYLEDMSGKPGEYSSTSQYIDRVLAHEMVHATLGATVENYQYVPSFIKEGLGELIQGVDDHRSFEIKETVNTSCNLYYDANSTHEDYLRKIFTLDDLKYLYGTESYGASYTLLRYMAKQVSDYSMGKAFEELKVSEASFGEPTLANYEDSCCSTENFDYSLLKLTSNI